MDESPRCMAEVIPINRKELQSVINRYLFNQNIMWDCANDAPLISHRVTWMVAVKVRRGDKWFLSKFIELSSNILPSF